MNLKNTKLRRQLAQMGAFAISDVERLAPELYVSQIYSLLHNSVRKGELERTGKREYRVTEKGRQAWWRENAAETVAGMPPCPGRLLIVRGLPGSGVSATGADYAKRLRRAFLEPHQFAVRGGHPVAVSKEAAFAAFLEAVRLFGEQGVDLVVGLPEVTKEPLSETIAAYSPVAKPEVLTLNRSLAECAAANRCGLTERKLEERAAYWADFEGETIILAGAPYAAGLLR